ncbi:MAG TPA: hypothetical protein PLT93_12080, partial [Phycisphaerae bacterium]|nr:hypothetical protein [Phycisphaerae bacterium]
ILDELLTTLESRLGARSLETQRNDAISAVLNDEPRRTAAVSLADAPAVEAFRQALTDGLIRVDTANRLLRLINEIVVRLIP